MDKPRVAIPSMELLGIVEPTNEQCNTGFAYPLSNGWVAHCGWFPQLAGYRSKMVAVPDRSGCVDLYVWHDGEFPLSENNPGKPAEWHLCNPGHLIELGEWLEDLVEALKE